MIKAVKKLKKLWPKKKRRKKTHQEPHYLPPPPCPCCCSYSSPVQPSAPPLPPWLVPDQTNETVTAPGVQQYFPEVSYQSRIQFQSQEIIVETNPICPTLPIETTPLTYQQYTVPNPVYGVPVVETPRRESSGGFFGCIISYGVDLIRCFCPCFRIREVD